MATATRSKKPKASKKTAGQDPALRTTPSKIVDGSSGSGMALESNKLRNQTDKEQSGVTSNPLAIEPRLRGVVRDFGPNVSGKVRSMNASGTVVSVSGNNITISSKAAEKAAN